jgi:hypothetical protein
MEPVNTRVVVLNCQWRQLRATNSSLLGDALSFERLLRGQPSNAWRWRHQFLDSWYGRIFEQRFLGRGRESTITLPSVCQIHRQLTVISSRRGRNDGQVYRGRMCGMHVRTLQRSSSAVFCVFLFCFILLFYDTFGRLLPLGHWAQQENETQGHWGVMGPQIIIRSGSSWASYQAVVDARDGAGFSE